MQKQVQTSDVQTDPEPMLAWETPAFEEVLLDAELAACSSDPTTDHVRAPARLPAE